MVLLISSHSRILISPNTLSRLNFSLTPSLISTHNPKNRAQICRLSSVWGHSFGFLKVRRDKKFGGYLDESWCCLCRQSEGDLELEAKIMEFMEKSENPMMFPTREELARAGRMDLVESIKKIGGWYTLGWDEENVEEKMDFDPGDFLRRVDRIEENVSLGEKDDFSLSGDDKEDEFSSGSDSNSENLNSTQLASSSAPSGRSLEMSADADTGIEGILNRLEKQRISNFVVDLEQFGYGTHATSKDEADDSHFGTSSDVARVDNGENGRHPTGRHQGILNKPNDMMSPNFEPETWRNWSNQRAGFHYSEFEAAEISFGKNIMEHDRDTYRDISTAINGEYGEAWDGSEEINLNHIKSRIQHLELELSTALHSLRSKREESTTDEVDGISVNDFQKLSDEREFQENEFMSAQERLRSIRAKMSILEGKMAMAITDAQKIVEKKQEQTYRAHKALKHLRDTCIVWHNSASEVLLTGSFDGWTTQRKMEKSETGIFSVNLMLYPGRYEIKFIVDGIWKVDPLRPIVNNSGYQNNLLIVT